eukprot:1159158-Pelagomonas_calceolata.AAC.4
MHLLVQLTFYVTVVYMVLHNCNPSAQVMAQVALSSLLHMLILNAPIWLSTLNSPWRANPKLWCVWGAGMLPGPTWSVPWLQPGASQ